MDACIGAACRAQLDVATKDGRQRLDKLTLDRGDTFVLGEPVKRRAVVGHTQTDPPEGGSVSRVVVRLAHRFPVDQTSSMRAIGAASP